MAGLLEIIASSGGVMVNDIRAVNETISSVLVGTTFRPLGEFFVRALLGHGYQNCMNMCRMLLDDFPLFDNPPSFEEFQHLARGFPRKRHPTSSDAPLTSVLNS
jgi:hypothetical protein